MADKPQQPFALIRLPAVRARVGLCRSSIYARVADGTFPKPISLGARAIAWDSREIDRWISDRIADGQKAKGAAP